MVAVSERAKQSILRLGEFADACGATRRYNKADACGDWRLEGRAGWVYAEPEGYYLYCNAGSPRAWGFAKKELLNFCEITQDGDDEGFLRMTRLPTPAEGEIIRAKLGLKKARQMTEAAVAAVARARVNSPLQGKRLAKGG